jgi:hypothetical protein
LHAYNLLTTKCLGEKVLPQFVDFVKLSTQNAGNFRSLIIFITWPRTTDALDYVHTTPEWFGNGHCAGAKLFKNVTFAITI